MRKELATEWCTLQSLVLYEIKYCILFILLDFEPTSNTCTPKLGSNQVLTYRTPETRATVIAPENSSISKPNYEDALRRVSVVVYQHIMRCETRWRNGQVTLNGTVSHRNPIQFGNAVMKNENIVGAMFAEHHFTSKQYKYTFHRMPQLHPMTYFAMTEVKCNFRKPTIDEIYQFCLHLFKRAQLSAECSIVSLIYVERLMEKADVPLLGQNWKPIMLCGMLLASKVWQDLSSWNIEFSSVYPQFHLSSINRLERQFLHYIEWDLYISGSVYAKYYFALRSLTEKKDFRRKYNYSMNIDAPNAKRLEQRSQEVQTILYSKSL